ncbi:MAG TPA: ABC transporter permease [Candidatus Acidoferrales bacterium]|nr:ABC transporter permease [Candidatus Acidoferrales bacterium]
MLHEWLAEAWLRAKALVKRNRLERDLEEEIQFHLAMRAEKNRALGIGAKDAKAAAHQRFGNVTLVKQDCREAWIFTRLETLWQDLRYAARMLTKSPGFAAIVVCSLALGIGANTAVFSALNSVMLHGLPYEHPEKLATIWSTNKTDPDSEGFAPIAEVTDWKKQNHVFADIAVASMASSATLTGIGEPGPVLVQGVTPNFFAVVGVQPALGRVFRAEESQEKFQTVVISNSLWKRKFNSDPVVLGKTFRITEVASTVVGVMPAGFIGFAPWDEGKAADVWKPLNPESAAYAKRSDHWRMPVARLKPGVTLAQAQLEMDVIARGMEQAYPESNQGVGEKVIPLYDTLYQNAKDKLYPLLGAVGFILLIACVNVANLTLSRTEGHRKEYSLRASLGAGRRRLVQQLLAESGLLTLIGGSLGVLLSLWGTHLLRVLAEDLPGGESIGINGRVLVFAAGLSVLTALLFGLAPALRASRADLNDVLREGESRTSSAKRGRMRNLLVISEVALGMVLLVGSGLMINSLLRILLPSPGFDPANVLTMAVNFPETEGKYVAKVPGKDLTKVSPKVTAYHQQLIERVAAMPGVESAGMISILPPLGAGDISFSILGHPAPSPGKSPSGGFNEVSPSYFRTMKIPLKKGRYLEESDTQSSPWAVVISETLANRYFPNEDPIGQQILLRREPDQVNEDRPRQIVGVVGEVKQVGMGGLHPLLYESFLQQPEVSQGDAYFHRLGSLVIRTTSDVRTYEAAITASVKQMVKEMDPDQPVTDISTMDEVLGKSMRSYKNYVVVLGVFAGIAVVLAAIGVYGVLSYFVNQRTRELGIRYALGAQRRDVLVLVAKLGLTLVGTGLAIGVALALGLNRFLAEHLRLFHVKATDPTTFAAVGTLLLFIALLACYIPARRATSVDPMTALRHE